MRSESLRKKPFLALFALAAGCSYDWDSLRPNGSVSTPDVVTDRPRTDATDESRTDAPGDRVTPDIVTDTPVVDTPPPDVTQPDVPSLDAADVTDASDASDVSDALDASDVRDASDVTDASDAIDVMDVRDVIDVADVPVDMGPLDTGPPDVGPPDTGPVCSGPPAMCPCSATNTAGYCRPGEACTGGRCEPGTVAGSLVITEILNDPDSVLDEVGEWFEVYNPGATPLDLRGMRISNSRTQSTSVTSTTPVIVAPRSYAVLGRNATTMTNGGVTVVYAYGATVMTNVLTFGNTSMDAVIIDLGSTASEIDRVAYDGSTASLWPRTSGKSKSLRPTVLSHTENDTPANWCNAPAQWVTASGDYGSPGAANPPCP